MIDWSACPAVERSADTLSGAWRFKNTRVPVKALFEDLEDGAMVEASAAVLETSTAASRACGIGQTDSAEFAEQIERKKN